MDTSFESRRAARAIAMRTEIPLAERKELLAMIGLLDEEGQYRDLQVTLTAPTSLGDSTDVKVTHHREAAWDRSTVPPGLRDLPPPAPESKSSKPTKAPKVEGGGCGDKRGTLTGRKRHQVNGSPVCPECAQAHAAWQRDYKTRLDPCGDERGTPAGVLRHKKWRAKMCTECALVAKDMHRQQRLERRNRGRSLLPTRSDTCGTMAGRSNHLRRGEALCRACKDAQNDYQRKRRLRRLAAEQEEGAA